MSRLTVPVVAGILYNHNGEFLLSSRPAGKPYAGYWEFAGGKVEAGEDDLSALAREWQEELGIRILHATPWLTRIHDYEHARVRLRFYRIAADDWQGQPQAHEGQGWCWQRPGHFDVAPMLPANTPILRALSIPQQLSGRLDGVFRGHNGSEEYILAVWPQAEAHHRQVLFDSDQLIQRYRLPADTLCFALVRNAQEYRAAADADALVWVLPDEQALPPLLAQLQAGVAQPLLALLSPSLAKRHAAALRSAGIHGLMLDEGTALA